MKLDLDQTLAHRNLGAKPWLLNYTSQYPNTLLLQYSQHEFQPLQMENYYEHEDG